MATIKFIAAGSSSTEDFSTSVLGPWGTDTACFFAMITAYSGASSVTYTVVNGGVTWTGESIESPYASRRDIVLFVADGVPTDVALDIECTGSSGTYAESLWCAFEIAEWDGTNRIQSGPSVASTGGATGLSASVGTLIDDQLSILIGGVESGSATNLAMNGDDLVGSIQEGKTDVRAMIVGSSTTDAVPDFTWTTSSAAGILAIRSSDGATGSHASSSSGALTGTVTASIDESDIQTGGNTVILTLTGDTFVTGTTSEDAVAGGGDSDETGANKWDALIKTDLDNTDLVLSVGDTIATITLPAYGTYDTDATETITWTIPAASLTTSTSDIIVTNTFTIAQVAAASSTPSLTLLGVG